ncbi:MAG: VCBS repeat-containing protein [bacterium]|nr:VCBS repeat-containing protein [bacterium]
MKIGRKSFLGIFIIFSVLLFFQACSENSNYLVDKIDPAMSKNQQGRFVHYTGYYHNLQPGITGLEWKYEQWKLRRFIPNNPYYSTSYDPSSDLDDLGDIYKEIVKDSREKYNEDYGAAGNNWPLLGCGEVFEGYDELHADWADYKNICLDHMDNFAAPVLSGDFDGSGKDDFGFFSKNWAHVFPSDGESFQDLPNNKNIWYEDQTDGNFAYSVVSGDFNGDQKKDIAIVYYNSYYGIAVRVLTSTGSELLNQGLWWNWSFNYNFDGSISDLKSVLSGDFDGDGFDDLAFISIFPDYNSSDIVVLKSNVSSFVYEYWWDHSYNLNYFNVVGSGDFTGDGKDDIAFSQDYDGNRRILIATSHSGGSNNFGYPGVWENFFPDNNEVYKWLVGKFNSDNFDDIAMIEDAGNNNMNIKVFNGDINASHDPSSWWQSGPIYHSQVQSFNTGDFDGNGKDDIMILYNYGTTGHKYTPFHARMLLSNSSQFQNEISWWKSSEKFNPNYRACDVKLGDGENGYGIISQAFNHVLFTQDYDKYSCCGYDDISHNYQCHTDTTPGACSCTAKMHGRYATGVTDFNGDGRSDMYQVLKTGGPNPLYVWLANSNGDGFGSRQEWGKQDDAGTFGPANDWQIGTADFNGDGKADMYQVYKHDANNRLYVWLAKSDGSGFENYQHWGEQIMMVDGHPVTVGTFGAAGYDCEIGTADFNGDGKTDMYQANKGGSGPLLVWITKSDGSGFIERQPWGSFGAANDWQIGTADFNGDGKTDMYMVYKHDSYNRLYVWLANSNGDGFENYQAWGLQYNGSAWIGTFGAAEDDSQIGTADFNGDGKTDMYQASKGGGLSPLYVWITKSDASGFNNFQPWGLQNNTGTFGSTGEYPLYPIQTATKTGTADFNGDGKTDMYQVSRHDEPNPLYVWITKSDASGFEDKQPWGLQDYAGTFGGAFFWQIDTADFNGDGKMDMWQLYNFSESNPLFVWKTLSDGSGFEKYHHWGEGTFSPEGEWVNP